MFFKRLLSITIAFTLSIVLSVFFSQSEKFWMPLATLFVMQTSAIISLRKGLIRFFIFTVIVMVITLFTTRYAAMDWTILYLRLRDVAWGAVIGIFSNLLIFPGHPEVEFRKDILPILEVYSNYLATIIDLLFQETHAAQTADEQKIVVEKTLLKFTPIWVYERGFSITFRTGHRHFLIMVERVGQILFSMHHIARHKMDAASISMVGEALRHYLASTQKFFSALITVINLQKLQNGVSDLSEEMVEFENALRKIMPPSLELIELSDDYIYLDSFGADLKDLRWTLVRLAESLRYK